MKMMGGWMAMSGVRSTGLRPRPPSGNIVVRSAKGSRAIVATSSMKDTSMTTALTRSKVSHPLGGVALRSALRSACLAAKVFLPPRLRPLRVWSSSGSSWGVSPALSLRHHLTSSTIQKPSTKATQSTMEPAWPAQDPESL